MMIMMMMICMEVLNVHVMIMIQDIKEDDVVVSMVMYGGNVRQC